MDYQVIVVGAGAAGLLAAGRLAELNRSCLLLEKNNKTGVKILMSGGTRCNITHATNSQGIVRAFGPQGRFLHSALAALSPEELVELFETEGVKTKVEETGKVFPVSNRALDVRNALMNRGNRFGFELATAEGVETIDHVDQQFVVTTDQRELRCEKLLLTTGGQSFPGCGTTGDGYRWVQKLGHTLVPTRPSLSPLTSNENWLRDLKGITLDDVQLTLVSTNHLEGEKAGKRVKGKNRPGARGSMLFTHFGLSGPLPMNLSRIISSASGTQHEFVCDFFPDQNETQIREKILRRKQDSGAKSATALLAGDLPRRLIEAILSHSQVSLETKCAELSKHQTNQILIRLKAMPISVSGTLGFAKAEVTAGGVPLHEVHSKTMESKILPNLFFAGEILDLDGPIGGFNFQAAFSTGWLAASNI